MTLLQPRRKTNVAEAFIYDSVRTPRGKLRGGALTSISPIQLAATPLRALAARNELATEAVEDVVYGCVVATGEQGGCITRAAVLAADWDQSVPGMQLSRFCSSGLEAVNMAAARVMAGQADLTVGGGVESMSRVPMGSDRGSWQADPHETYETYYVPQGISADLIATKHGYTRYDLDSFAAESQRRTAAASQAGSFDGSIVPVHDLNGDLVLDRDEHPRPQTTVESLGALPPAFAKIGAEKGWDARALLRYPEVERIQHDHTAGNSSGIVDGAAAMLIGTAEIGQRLGLTPRARIRAMASIGSEPTIMLTGPTAVSQRALARAGMTAGDIDLFEINEAFASVALSFMEGVGADHDKTNIDGGSIAMGHPLGATGAMILGTLLDAMERKGLGTGLATLCVGGGMGTATIIERL
ncbi:acetyl-CoA C-acetyltransferase [Roseobacter sp. HKCCD9010]|nr:MULTISPECIES: acetyl-CoA C-acetyltransferase [unclassified Roseobacter]MBF9049267.1 acetyl-CoA C-acetyltransferase [Rhodobacterales bacterium HKCCD4356]NNV71341.1 acetyl-CoA C-acetyltransferase [Roseobacter sp. HKCCD5932]NNV75591.1 acetyl-CoA C-acetyltransferase [Roseobacter sp. HKCCD6135]NNW48010.1 acetyl-CoA C-acetyltransferase [Roseobacter sp. HKCCD9144]NNX24697.1 acetyl-CoA C-acetyltransferase [Roseobacter sp. HKCCD6925]NNY31181.1 acetyl-CoA C-acetyltransferase [Roseobacter sp. HKCCD90